MGGMTMTKAEKERITRWLEGRYGETVSVTPDGPGLLVCLRCGEATAMALSIASEESPLLALVGMPWAGDL
jgi:hypothetical protein